MNTQQQRADDNDTVGYTPTKLELRGERALTALGLRFVRQQRFGLFTVDAYLPSYRIALEFDGCWAHACTQCGYATDFAKTRYAIARDAELLTRYRVLVMHVPEHLLRDDAQALITLSRVLAHKLDATQRLDAYAH